MMIMHQRYDKTGQGAGNNDIETFFVLRDIRYEYMHD